MFKLAIVSLALLNVGLAASAVTPAAPAGAPGSDAANAISVLTTCTGVNFGSPCILRTSTVLPTACIGLFDQNDAVSSVQTASGVQCTLYRDFGCAGPSQLVVGAVPDLGPVGFNDVASSFRCASA